MKKRRELDALIGNRIKKDALDGTFEYDSLNSGLSSPTADTYMPPNYYNPAAKRISRSSPGGCGCTLRKLIRICLPICFLSLVAACITACIGIVWMQVQLKTDVDKLKDHVAKLETWHAEQPASLDDMKKSVFELTKDINAVKDGEFGVKSLAERLGVLTEKFEDQVKVPSEKLQEVESESGIIKTKVEKIESMIDTLKQKSSQSKTAQELLSASFSKVQGSVDSLQTELSSDNAKQLDLINMLKQSVEEKMEQFNASMQITSKNITVLDRKVESLRKYNTDSLTKNRRKPTKTTVLDKTPSHEEKELVPAKEEGGDTEDHSDVVTAHSDKDTSPGPNQDTETRDTGVKESSTDSLSELKDNFQSIDANHDNSLSQNELEIKYGDQTRNYLASFDSSNDGSLSYDEINAEKATAVPDNSRGKKSER